MQIVNVKHHQESGKLGAASTAVGGRNAALRELRRRIVEGLYPPGSQVPTRIELERDLGVSSVTVQRAMDRLRREGLVRVNACRSTHVVPHPPHLFHYAMVFAKQAGFAAGSRFMDALIKAAARYDGSDAEPRRIAVHYGIEDHSDNRELRGLLAAVRSHGLAGIIFAEHPGSTRLAFSSLGEAPLPRVSPVIGAPLPGFGGIRFGNLLPRAMDHFAALGRKRLAVLSVCPPDDGTPLAGLAEAVRSRGLTLPPYWIQTAHLDMPASARNIAHLLFRPGRGERPDALFIADDNLVEYALMGLLDAGVKVPEEVAIVAHWNFPAPHPSIFPIQRIGYDAREVLAACLAELANQRRGQPPGLQPVEAKFEAEIA